MRLGDSECLTSLGEGHARSLGFDLAQIQLHGRDDRLVRLLRGIKELEGPGRKIGLSRWQRRRGGAVVQEPGA